MCSSDLKAAEAARLSEIAKAEAAKAAARAESARTIEPPRTDPGRVVASTKEAVLEPLTDAQLTEKAQQLVAAALPGAPLYVANVLLADDRAVLRPVWKAHRARVLATGDFRSAFSVAAVVSALNDAPKGALLAAHVVRDGGDLLVWFDLRGGNVVAALDNAMGWGVVFA